MMATLWSSTRDGPQRRGRPVAAVRVGRPAAALVALVAAGLVLAGRLGDLGRAAAARTTRAGSTHARRRPAGGGRHRPVLVEQHARSCAPGSARDDGGWRLHTGPGAGPGRPQRLRPGRPAAAEHRHQPGRARSRCVSASATGPTRDGAALPDGRPQRLVDLRPAGPEHLQRAAAAPGRRRRAGGPAGPRTCPGYGEPVPLRRRCSTSTCRAACTARPTGSGWPTEPADTRLGGGIFLHVSGPGRDRGLRLGPAAARCAGCCAGWTRPPTRCW